MEANENKLAAVSAELETDEKEPDEHKDSTSADQETQRKLVECGTRSCDLLTLCGPTDDKSRVPLAVEEKEDRQVFQMPMCIQREVASLDRRFGIRLNESRPILSKNAKNIYLSCTISMFSISCFAPREVKNSSR